MWHPVPQYTEPSVARLLMPGFLTCLTYGFMLAAQNASVLLPLKPIVYDK